MKKVIKELYGVIWKIVFIIGFMILTEIAWLVVNW